MGSLFGLESNGQHPGLIIVIGTLDFGQPSTFEILVVLKGESGEEILFAIIKFVEFALEGIDEFVLDLIDAHLLEADTREQIEVLLASVESVVALFHVIDELLAQLTIAAHVISEDDSAAGLEPFEKVLEQVRLLLDVQQSVPTVDDIVVVLGEFSLCHVAQAKVYLVLDVRLLVVVSHGNVHHVLGQIHCVNVHAILFRHVKIMSAKTGAHVKESLTGLELEFGHNLFGGREATGREIFITEDPFVSLHTILRVLDLVEELLKFGSFVCVGTHLACGDVDEK